MPDCPCSTTCTMRKEEIHAQNQQDSSANGSLGVRGAASNTTPSTSVVRFSLFGLPVVFTTRQLLREWIYSTAWPLDQAALTTKTSRF